MSLLNKIKDQIVFDFSPKTVSYINLYNYTILRKNNLLLKEINVFTSDGFALCIILKIFFGRKIVRKSPDFSSFFSQLFEVANEENRSAYFVGGTNSEIKQFESIIEEKYPNLIVKKAVSGYNLDYNNLVSEIVSTNTDFLILGLGTPLQENISIECLKKGYNGSCYTCGAFISQTALKGEKYYPDIINSLNLRWAYRIYNDPKLLRRYLIDYPKGVFYFIKDNI